VSVVGAKIYSPVPRCTTALSTHSRSRCLQTLLHGSLAPSTQTLQTLLRLCRLYSDSADSADSTWLPGSLTTLCPHAVGGWCSSRRTQCSAVSRRLLAVCEVDALDGLGSAAAAAVGRRRHEVFSVVVVGGAVVGGGRRRRWGGLGTARRGLLVAAALLLLLTNWHRQLADGLPREVALGTWSSRLHSRKVVRPGCVLLGGKAPDVSTALGLWVHHHRAP
jgi:hypothetical protein